MQDDVNGSKTYGTASHSAVPAEKEPLVQGPVSDPVPVGGPLNGGDPSALNNPSIAPPPPPLPTLSDLVASNAGRCVRLPSGEAFVSRDVEIAGGSMSSVERNEVCSSSGFVLVIVTN